MRCMFSCEPPDAKSHMFLSCRLTPRMAGCGVFFQILPLLSSQGIVPSHKGQMDSQVGWLCGWHAISVRVTPLVASAATRTALCVPTGVSPIDPLTGTFCVADSGSNVVGSRDVFECARVFLGC